MLHTVSRAGSVLNLFSIQTPEWGVSQVAKALGIPKSTASELMASLAKLDLLYRTSERSYRLGWKLVELGQTLLNTTEFYPEAHHALQEFVGHWREAGSLTVLSGNQAVCLERVSTTSTKTLLSHVGMRLPVYASGSGKVLLAHQQWAEVKRVLAEQTFMPLTPNTITTKDALVGELEQIQHQGYAYDREEVLPGLCAISAPIRDIEGNVTAGITMLLRAQKFYQQTANYTDILLKTADHVSEQMGYQTKHRKL